MLNIRQDSLDHQFRLPIGIGCRSGKILPYRYGTWLSVYRCGGAEYKIPDMELLHGLQYDHGGQKIVSVVGQRLCYRLSHRFVTCKMNHGIYVFLFENPMYCIRIAEIRFIKRYFFPGNLFHPVNRFFFTVVQVICDNHLIACSQKLYTGMTADIAGTPRYQYCHINASPSCFCCKPPLFYIGSRCNTSAIFFPLTPSGCAWDPGQGRYMTIQDFQNNELTWNL